MAISNPTGAWKALREGNDRFVAGQPQHPSQGVERRALLVDGQAPNAAIFGCGDSRVAAELIFDQGLGDTFVVRTAGHVVDGSVLGSIEYAVQILNVPLIVVLGHDKCGAVAATLNALDNGDVPGGSIRSIVEKVTPSILIGRREGLSTTDEFETRHVVETGRLLMERSMFISQKVATGECAIACATYALSDGQVKLHRVIGNIGELP
ncbi:MAG: carbonic anhydrase [Mycobacteriaceae bacterium]|nr:carbonic anhydrase [Mycobacteriaceae bacterium]